MKRAATSAQPRWVYHPYALCKNLYLLHARQRLPIDSLTPRELAIAREVSEGLTYKEIARKLGIAPATVCPGHRLKLTQSWCFGGQIAEIANRVLAEKVETSRVVGMNGEGELWPVDTSRCAASS